MDFEEWFNSPELDNWTNKKYMHDAFEAGQQSKQAEIDALKMTNHNLSVQIIDANAYAEHWQKLSNKSQTEIDALQKRIDDALNEIESGITGKHHVKRIIKILKGELK